jgi:hypothetical protein
MSILESLTYGGVRLDCIAQWLLLLVSGMLRD